jgi:uncharacterized protein
MERLIDWFRGKDGAVVAFSGGVDSSIVAAAAKDALGDRAIAVTSSSSTFPAHELEIAKKVAEEIGIEHRIIFEDELENPNFVKNPPDRCYHCRKGLVEGLKKVAERHGISTIVDGANADDTLEHRPGLKAMKEAGVRSPLLELGIGKKEVRRMARERGLSIHDKPSMACLASRIPYGERITKEKLARIEKAEDFIRGLGFEQARVRHHNSIARIEVRKGDIPKIVENREIIAKRLRELGFAYVSLDLEGYRTGSMDEVL